MNTFAENLSVMRKRAGLTQEELADKVNVSVDTIRRWEGDKQEPRLSELKLIAKVLGIKINQLAGDDETENTPNIMQEKLSGPNNLSPRRKVSSLLSMEILISNFQLLHKGMLSLKIS